MNNIRIKKFDDNNVSPYLKKLKEASDRPSSKKRAYSRKGYYGMQKRKKFSIPALLFLFSLLFVVASIFLFLFNAKAKIEIVGKTVFLNLPEDITYKVYSQPEDPQQLRFEVVSAQTTVEDTIKADRKEYVKQKAKGKIIVYNNYQKQPLRIIKNTRFQTSDGKVYRAQKSFVIPGYKEKNDKKVPGQVEIVVYADEPGEQYNIDSAKFRLPGLKGTKMYDDVWAETATKITGGYIGEKPVVSQQLIDQKTQQLKQQAQQDLETKIYTNENMIILPDSLTFNYSVSQEPQSNQIKLILQAKLSAIGFNETEFVDYLAKENNIELEQGEKDIVNKDELQLALLDKDAVLPEQATEVEFEAKGIAKIRWELDPEKIKSVLEYQPIKNFDQIMSEFNGIKSKTIVSTPIFGSKFPSKDKIEIDLTFE